MTNSINLSRALRTPLAAALLISIALSALSQPAAPPADPAQIARGRETFIVKGCYECHGYVGQGSAMSGPTLAGLPISLEGMDLYLRAPTGQMPPYSKKILSVGELQDIFVFMTSLPAPAKGR